MRNSLRALSVLAAPALVLGVATPAFASTVASSTQLASTGAQITGWIIAAVAFLVLGGLLFFVAQRGRVKARTDEAALTAALESAETPETGLGEAAADATATASDAAGAVATPPATAESAPSEAPAAAPEPGAGTEADGEPRGGNTPA